MNSFFDEQFYVHEKFESQHFWSKIKRSALHVLINRHIPKEAFILEVGASTCLISGELSERGYKNIRSGDINDKAISFAKEKYPQLKNNISKIDVENFSYPDRFNCIIHSELLEHVDDHKALQNIINSLKKNGVMIFSVPALPYLFSPFDERLGHQRRYTQKTIQAVLEQNGFQVEYISYLFMFLLPFLVPVRFFQKIFPPRLNHNSFKIPPAVINKGFEYLMKLELAIWKKINLPIGTSLVVVARKI